MRRPSPLASPLSISLTLLLFGGLGISLWLKQGVAFSPGGLTAIARDGEILQGFTSHADFERRCGLCHRPLQNGMAEMCINCHAEIAAELQNTSGLHSKIANVNQCWVCHPDHRGRDFDPLQASLPLFDHSVTNFSLAWHQVDYNATPLECTRCHPSSNFDVVQDSACTDCHAAADQAFMAEHIQQTGEYCLACHDGSDRMRSFTHAQTDFPLAGQHSGLDCSACHADNQLQNTPQNCADCHAEPSQHAGLFVTACGDCHVPDSWSLAKLDGQPFSHLENASFSLALHTLDYSEQAINCQSCHPDSLRSFSLQTCLDCHTQAEAAFMADHQAQFGPGCLECHDGVDRMSNFEHANFFLLDGQHAIIDCTDCHVEGPTGRIFRGTPSECAQCHPEPEVHAGVFGLKCYYCHLTQAWTPASLRVHHFPLGHGLEASAAQPACETCHLSSYIEYTCYNCHEHEAVDTTQKHAEVNISAQELPNCAQCHPDGVVVEESK